MNSYSSPSSIDLAKIKIASLPSSGTLKLSGVSVTANQEIAAAGLDGLIYTPNSNFTGNDSFVWYGSDGTSYSTTSAKVNITVASPPPDWLTPFGTWVGIITGVGALAATIVGPPTIVGCCVYGYNRCRAHHAPAGAGQGQAAPQNIQLDDV